MDKSDMLLQIIRHYTSGNKARFSRKLGVSAQTISAWVERGTFDAELIRSKCEGISGDWLLTGEDEMLRTVSPDKQQKYTSDKQNNTFHKASDKNMVFIRFLKAYEQLLKTGKISDKKDLANKIGISPSLLTEISKGRSAVGVAPVQKLVLTFGISANWLLTGNGAMLLSDGGDGTEQASNDNAHLKREIELLRQLLDEKERLIKVLLEHNKKE